MAIEQPHRVPVGEVLPGVEHNSVEFLGALVAYTEHLRREEAAGWSDDESAPVQADDDYI